MEYKPVPQRRFPRLSERETAENRQWQKLKVRRLPYITPPPALRIHTQTRARAS